MNDELKTIELDYDELAIEADETNFEPWTDDERRAHYAAKYADELTVWHKEDVENALECGAITQEQADAIEVFDPAKWEQENKEATERANAALREFYAAYVASGLPFGLSAGDLVNMTRCGFITQEKAEELAQMIDDHYRELAARNAG